MSNELVIVTTPVEAIRSLPPGANAKKPLVIQVSELRVGDVINAVEGRSCLRPSADNWYGNPDFKVIKIEKGASKFEEDWQTGEIVEVPIFNVYFNRPVFEDGRPSQYQYLRATDVFVLKRHEASESKALPAPAPLAIEAAPTVQPTVTPLDRKAAKAARKAAKKARRNGGLWGSWSTTPQSVQPQTGMSDWAKVGYGVSAVMVARAAEKRLARDIAKETVKQQQKAYEREMVQKYGLGWRSKV